MQVEKYLQKNQPIIYKTFLRAIEEDKLSHAYLLVGNPGTPLFDVAKFLAKSIVCDDPSPLACNNCISCLRIDDNNYPDFILIDGSKESIKKGDVGDIESKFEKTAFETKGKMIYVLHLIENMTEEAINSILKFLEEPKPNVYAFLTTNNENKILPTIISRCQTMHLKLIDRRTVINDAIELGIEAEDSEILSYFYNDPELIFELFNKEDKEKDKENYLKIKDYSLVLINSLNECDNKETIFNIETKVIPYITNKESHRMFLDIIALFFEDLLNIQNQKDITLKSYDTILHELCNKITNIDKILLEIYKQRNLINLNLNTSLQLSHLVLAIAKEQ